MEKDFASPIEGLSALPAKTKPSPSSRSLLSSQELSPRDQLELPTSPLASGQIQPEGPHFHSQLFCGFQWLLRVEEPDNQTGLSLLTGLGTPSQLRLSQSDCDFPPWDQCPRAAQRPSPVAEQTRDLRTLYV